MFAYFFDPAFDYLSTSLRRTLLLHTIEEHALKSNSICITCYIKIIQ